MEAIRQNSEVRRDYQKWLKDPITEAVFAIVQQASMPAPPALELLVAPGSQVGTALHMQQVGAWHTITCAMNLDRDEKAMEEANPDYGARGLLEDAGIIKAGDMEGAVKE